MTDVYMPDVAVEIAFNAGYTTPAASRTWTDVSAYVELADRIDITVGRQDERSTADANTLTLTLDNSDGRFTAARAASPYYPNVKIGRPIRVKVTPNTNAHPNGGLEVDATGWYSNSLFSSWGLSTMARSTTRAHEGSASLLVTWPTHATGSQAGANFSTTIGATYTASCWVWVPAGSPDPRLDCLFSGASARTSLKNQWVYLTHTFVATNTIHAAGVQVASPTAGQQCWVDEFMVNRGATALPYTAEVVETSTRFLGFIDEWPVEWDSSDAYARATITASSRRARLGLSTKLRSMIEQEILQDDPDDYFTLGESSGSTTAADSSGNANDLLHATGSGAAFTFGSATGPGTDGMTALELAGGQHLVSGETRAVSGTAQSLSCFLLRSGVPAAAETVISTDLRDGSMRSGIVVRVLVSGVVEVGFMAAGGATLVQVTGSDNVCDGATHHVAVTRSGTTWGLYVDGALDASTGAGTPDAITTWRPALGDSTIDLLLAPQTTFSGVIAHAAFWSSTTVSATRIAAHASMGAVGYTETTDERLLRMLGWAGIASSEVDADAGSETMTYQLTSGQSVVDALQEVEATEGGVLFDGADGNVKFHSRSRRYTATAAVTLDMTSQHVGADYAPKLDRSTLANDVEVSNPTTEQAARAVDTSSRDEYGEATTSATSVADSYAALQQKAAWLLASYAEPRSRVPSLTVDVLAHQGLTPSAHDLLALTVGDLLAVTNAPTQADTTDTAYFVEGYSEQIGPESYSITFNLSPTYPTLDVLILDDPARGLLDTTNLLAY